MWHLNLAIKRLMVSSITMIFSHPFSDVSAFQCKALSRPPWGSMKCLPSASGPYPSGSSCEFSCDQGFELKGSTRLQCGPRGEWDSKTPTCSGAFSLEILLLSLPPSFPPSPLSLPQFPCVEIRGQLAEVDFLLMYGSQK